MSRLKDEERFRHVDYHHTDVTKTFARERKRLANEKAKQDAAQTEQQTKVRKLKQETK